MNDFTKDELEKIFYYVDITCHIQDDDEQQLLDKIQAMIDNYCEHEWQHGGADCICCAKCKKEVFYI